VTDILAGYQDFALQDKLMNIGTCLAHMNVCVNHVAYVVVEWSLSFSADFYGFLITDVQSNAICTLTCVQKVLGKFLMSNPITSTFRPITTSRKFLKAADKKDLRLLK